jgi:DNA-binding MarR family transcriptional regulator
MDSIKQAFQKVKQDIDFLKQETSSLKSNFNETRAKMLEICEIVSKINKKLDGLSPKNKDISLNSRLNTPTDTSTLRHINPAPSTHPSTHNLPLEGLNTQNMGISTGNQGASTDRQTDRQTDTSTHNLPINSKNPINNASEVLDSLDNIKKDIRLKFKRITEQELLIFSTIYQLDSEAGQTDYRALSEKLKLTESSIRDYVGRLIKKGIPVEKTKINNKNISLSISPNLKKIASLQTILQLRDI